MEKINFERMGKEWKSHFDNVGNIKHTIEEHIKKREYVDNMFFNSLNNIDLNKYDLQVKKSA